MSKTFCPICSYCLERRGAEQLLWCTNEKCSYSPFQSLVKPMDLDKEIKLAREGKSEYFEEVLFPSSGSVDLGFDPVNKPKHYNVHPSGVECIQITEHMNFCLGNALKYIWRADEKHGVEDLEKAVWYLKREIERRRTV